MKRLNSNSGKTATIELAHPAFDPSMDVYWLKIRWPDGSIYLDTVYFKEGDCEKRVTWRYAPRGMDRSLIPADGSRTPALVAVTRSRRK